jgi:hypothetical protein
MAPTPTTPTPQITIFLESEILSMGLKRAGFDDVRQQRVKRETNVRRFKSHFGSSPLVYAAIWEDLVTTDIPEARIEATTDPDKFFLGLYFLKEYPTEEKLAGSFKTCEKTARKWAWYFAIKIQALKKKKVNYVSARYVS